MTTNARDEKWSGWIDWSGGVCPIKKGDRCCVRYRNGEERIDVPAQSEGGHLALGGYNTTDGFWNNEGHACDIIAYRYRLDDNTMTPESDMHPDLEWLARNETSWEGTKGFCLIGKDESGVFYATEDCDHAYTYNQWLQARKDLGLVMSDSEEEIPAPEWSSTITDTQEEAAMVESMVNDESVPTSVKQLRYMDANGEDWIDEFARTASIDEFRGAMKFTIGKYNRRAGKKDELIKEIEKMRDYCDRWIKYERSL